MGLQLIREPLTFWKIVFNSLGSPRLVDCTYKRHTTETHIKAFGMTTRKHVLQEQKERLLQLPKGEDEGSFRKSGVLYVSGYESKQLWVCASFGEKNVECLGCTTKTVLTLCTSWTISSFRGSLTLGSLK